MKNGFENEYIMDKKLINEYVYNVLCKKMIINGLLIMLIGILFFYLIHNQYSYIFLTISIIIFLFTIMLPGVTIKEFEKSSKRLNNGKIEKTNIKFSNNIIMNEGKVHLEFEYGQINKIIQTKNFIVLKMDKQSAILVFKNGFLKGNKEDFIKFIEKNVK